MQIVSVEKLMFLKSSSLDFVSDLCGPSVKRDLSRGFKNEFVKLQSFILAITKASDKLPHYRKGTLSLQRYRSFHYHQKSDARLPMIFPVMLQRGYTNARSELLRGSSSWKEMGGRNGGGGGRKKDGQIRGCEMFHAMQWCLGGNGSVVIIPRDRNLLTGEHP